MEYRWKNGSDSASGCTHKKPILYAVVYIKLCNLWYKDWNCTQRESIPTQMKWVGKLFCTCSFFRLLGFKVSNNSKNSKIRNNDTYFDQFSCKIMREKSAAEFRKNTKFQKLRRGSKWELFGVHKWPEAQKIQVKWNLYQIKCKIIFRIQEKCLKSSRSHVKAQNWGFLA